ncbi:MAG: MarR family transcriptional regulator [Rubrivivax sp.]|nr:MarR family transcriptional regulator [Pyrinomonadaceae bacterium]
MANKSRHTKAKRKRPVASQAQEAFVTLFRTADRVRTVAAAIFEPYGITGQQYNVLRILRGAEPEGLLTLTVAERMIERTPGITRMIDRLEAKGLVTRERCTEDRRCVYCRITKQGLDLLARLDEPVEEGNWAAFAALNQAELAQLVTLLERVRKAHETA